MHNVPLGGRLVGRDHAFDPAFFWSCSECSMPAVRVASLSEIPPGTAREVVAGGRIVAIFNVAGTLRAVDGICPHAGGPLAEGQVTDGIVTCPWHGWQYDLATGKNCVNPAISAGCHAVRVEGDDVLVELP